MVAAKKRQGPLESCLREMHAYVKERVDPSTQILFNKTPSLRFRRWGRQHEFVFAVNLGGPAVISQLQPLHDIVARYSAPGENADPLIASSTSFVHPNLPDVGSKGRPNGIAWKATQWTNLLSRVPQGAESIFTVVEKLAEEGLIQRESKLHLFVEGFG